MTGFQRSFSLAASLSVFFGVAHLAYVAMSAVTGVFSEPIFLEMERTTVEIFGVHNYWSFYIGLNVLMGIYFLASGMSALVVLPALHKDSAVAARTSAFHAALGAVTTVLLLMTSHLVAVGIYAVITLGFSRAFLVSRAASRAAPQTSRA